MYNGACMCGACVLSFRHEQGINDQKTCGFIPGMPAGFKLFLLICVLDLIRKTTWRKNAGLVVAVMIIALIAALLLQLLVEAVQPGLA